METGWESYWCHSILLSTGYCCNDGTMGSWFYRVISCPLCDLGNKIGRDYNTMRDFMYFGFKIKTRYDNEGMVYYSIVKDASGEFMEATADYKSHGYAEKAGKDIAWRWYLRKRRKGHLEDILEIDLQKEELERVTFGGEGTQVKVGDVVFSFHFPRKPARIRYTNPGEGRLGLGFLPHCVGTHLYTKAEFNQSGFYKRREDWLYFRLTHSNVAMDLLKEFQSYIQLAFENQESIYRWFYSVKFQLYLFGQGDYGLWITISQAFTGQEVDHCILASNLEFLDDELLRVAALKLIRSLLSGFTEHPSVPRV